MTSESLLPRWFTGSSGGAINSHSRTFRSCVMTTVMVPLENLAEETQSVQLHCAYYFPPDRMRDGAGMSDRM